MMIFAASRLSAAYAPRPAGVSWAARRAVAGASWTTRLAVAAGLSLGTGPGSATAQETPDDEGVIYRQRTVYSFEGDTIDGDLMRPDGAYIEARKEIQHSNLIQVRDNFREKVLEAAVYL